MTAPDDLAITRRIRINSRLSRDLIIGPTLITVINKSGGPLTKQIALGVDGKPISDGSACVMREGTATRRAVNSSAELAALINGFAYSDALTLGTLRSDLPDKVRIVAKRNVNGADTVARTADNFIFEAGQPAFCLIDYDSKGAPSDVIGTVTDQGLWRTLCSVLPVLENCAYVQRASTSAGLYREDTRERFLGSGGLHIYLTVRDGADIPRFLRALHERCWLAGLGWYIVGVAGQLLERSIIDRMVGQPERLCFEAPPVLLPPLKQDADERCAVAMDGDVLDTVAACPDLDSSYERAQLDQVQTKAKAALGLQCDRARLSFIERRVEQMVKRGVPRERAEVRARQQCEGILLPDVELEFDDRALAGATVADVLRKPDKFLNQTLADPIEGRAYGMCCAKVLRKSDGTIYINSFAHGGTVYAISQPPRQQTVRTGNLAALKTMTFAPIKYVVPGIIVEGLTLFAGKPKIGKSWLLLHAGIAVARDGFTLGETHCTEGDVLYCALEDNERRLQSRVDKLIGRTQDWPSRFSYTCEMPRLANGGLEYIKNWIASKPNPRLIIIDTLAMVRAPKKRDETNYEADYAAALELRKLANETGVAIVLVHHLRKQDAEDAFDTVSGTLGLTGAPDSILVLKRETATGTIVLHGRGRDLTELALAMTFDKQGCTWRIVGEADQVRRSAERVAVLQAIEEAAGDPVGPNDIAGATGMKAVNVRKLLGKLLAEGAVEKKGYDKYRIRSGASPATLADAMREMGDREYRGAVR
jgi:hypothetical protein